MKHNLQFAITLIIFTFCVSHGHAADNIFTDDSPCTEVRLDLYGCTQHVKMVDQGSTDLCSGYAATSQIDAFRFSHGVTNYDLQTSPLALSSYTHYLIENNNKYVALETVLKFASAKSYFCPSQALRDLYGHEGLQKYLEKLEEEYRMFKLLKSNKRSSMSYEITNPLLLDLNISSKDVLGALKAKNLREYKARLFFAACKKHPDYSSSVSKYYVQEPGYSKYKTKRDRFLGHASFISNYLRNNTSQPVGIEYCAAVILDSKATPDPKIKKECGNHAGLIVGREMRNGKCQLLIRDTYGSSCDKYLNLGLMPQKMQKNCQDGRWWIDRDALLRNMTYASSLEPIK